MAIFEAFAIQIVYDSVGQISTIYHIDPSTIRAEKPDEFGRVNNWYISREWGSITNKANRRSSINNKAVMIPNYNPENWEEDKVQLLYGKRYVAGQDAYSIPSYNSATNWIQLDHELSKFELNKVASGFFPSIIMYLNGDPDNDAKSIFKNQFEKKYVGSAKSKILYLWGTGSDEKPEIIRMEADKNDTLFNDLVAISNQKIATSHGGSMELAGISDGGVSLGGDANKIAVGLAFYQKNVVRPMQEVLLSNFDKIFQHNNLGKVEVKYTPLDVEISSKAKEDEEEPTPDDKVIEQTVIRELKK